MIAYDKFMAPLEKLYLAEIREELMIKAHGKVLEIGFGNGANMKYYDFKKIDSFHALDLNENMKKFENITYHILNAEKLHFTDNSFDTVVLTLALCSIEMQVNVIREIKRVLKDDGIYIFLEHEKPQSKMLFGIFKLLNPLWRKLAKGCQLILESHKNIEKEGFELFYKNKGVFYYGFAKKKTKNNKK